MSNNNKEYGMFNCYNCHNSVSTVQRKEFNFIDVNSSFCQVCDNCIDNINSKLKVQIDFSKLRLLKHRIKCKQTRLY